MALKTLLESFYELESTSPDKPFLRQPFGEQWEVYTYGEAGQMARRLATGLRSLGLSEKAHIGLISKNCREWIIADLAIMMAGYVSVPFFPTLRAAEVAKVLELGDVEALFAGKLEGWKKMKNGVPKEMPIIRFPRYKGNAEIRRGEAWSKFIERFDPLEGHPSPALDDLWTIIFTSGTTGSPKGVMLPYRAPASLLESTMVQNPLRMSFSGENEFFSYLPLNHIAERAVIEGGCLYFGGQISFAESVDTFVKNLQSSNPTLFFGVPRIWAKLQMGILANMSQAQLNAMLKIPVVSGLLKRKIKSGLGMSQTRRFVSGAAPIAESLKQWFRRLDIPISEAYGMTENCAACTFLPGENIRPGSVGQAQEGVELDILGEQNEIRMRAPFVMTGYYKAPKETAQTLQDGWLHTGDQGRLDEEGYLYITGRVKDAFKTDKGEFISPTPIERAFEHNIDIDQLCLLGIGISQPILLVSLSETAASKPKAAIHTSLVDTLQEVNAHLPGYSRVSTIVVAKEPFSVENGLMTPTLKIKRNAMDRRYRVQLPGWHQENKMVVWEE